MSKELTVSEAAQRSGYSEGHIRRLARGGDIEARRVGRRVLVIDAQSLDNYTEKMRDLGTQKHAPGQ